MGNEKHQAQGATLLLSVHTAVRINLFHLLYISAAPTLFFGRFSTHPLVR